MAAMALSRHQKRQIALLGLPSFGLALAATTAVTYAPLIASGFTSSTTIVGSMIAAEGVVALFLPILAGAWSDHLRTRIGGRLPFLITGLPVAAVALSLMGFVDSITDLIALLVIFFAAYYLAYEPYRALYPDLIEPGAAGRAQSIQALWRGIGTGVALTCGGFLLAVTQWLPFIGSAVLVVVSTGIFVWVLLVKHGAPTQRHRRFESIRSSYKDAINSLRNHRPLRYFVLANMLWELMLAALKSFILLFLIKGLGQSKTTAATFIGIASVIMFIAAPLAGELGDRYGEVRVLKVAVILFGVGLLVPAFTVNPWFVLPIMPIAAFGGATVLTLPYAVMIPMMPPDKHGQLTGVYSTSRGIGIMLGPMLAGAAIALTSNTLPAHGYSAMWLVCGIAMLVSAIPLARIEPKVNKAKA